MSYHDDGEQGLGPIVASLSLGADATMSFRLKQPKKTRKGAQKDEMEAKDKPSTKPLIKLQLRHGDVTIMEGRGVQKDLDVSRFQRGRACVADSSSVSSTWSSPSICALVRTAFAQLHCIG